MEQIVITLLELARSEAGLLTAELQDIDLSSYCDEIWHHAIHASRSQRRLVKDIPDDLVISTDRDKLGIILANLFSNAVSYSPDDAEVQIRAAIRNQRVVLEVRNASHDLRPEDVLHMKDRFWRKQRTHAGSGHSGLGLTLVDALARILKLDIKLSLDQGQVFMVTISGLAPSPVTAQNS
jgi:signal transduction histidine kinase